MTTSKKTALKRSIPNQPRKILVQRADKLGDILLAIPVINALKSKYPNAQIDFLTSPIATHLFKKYPDINELIIVTEKEQSSLLQMRGLLKQLKKTKYDIYISLWNTPEFAILGRLANIPIRIGDKTNKSIAWLFTHQIHQHWSDFTRHQIEFNMDLLAPLGIPSQLVPGKLYPDPLSKQLQQKIEQLPQNRDHLAIMTGTGGSNHAIPEAPLLTFIQQISTRVNVILIGQDKHPERFTHPQSPGVLNLINQTQLPELLSIINHCDYFLGPDTGPTHMASFLQKPMIVFSSMKPNPPARWGSLSPIHRNIRRDYECEYLCVKQCHPNECFRFVTAPLLEQEFEALKQAQDAPQNHHGPNIKTQHCLHTIRVLLISQKDSPDTQAQINALQKQGLVIFHYIITQYTPRQLWRLISLVIRHNIMLIQGPVPKLILKLIQLYMGIICHYIPPKPVPFCISESQDISDYFEISKQG